MNINTIKGLDHFQIGHGGRRFTVDEFTKYVEELEAERNKPGAYSIYSSELYRLREEIERLNELYKRQSHEHEYGCANERDKYIKEIERLKKYMSLNENGYQHHLAEAKKEIEQLKITISDLAKANEYLRKLVPDKYKDMQRQIDEIRDMLAKR